MRLPSPRNVSSSSSDDSESEQDQGQFEDAAGPSESDDSQASSSASEDSDASSASSGDSSSDDDRHSARSKAKEFKAATKKIRKLLPAARCPPPRSARDVAGPLVDQDDLRRRRRKEARSLPQPPAFKVALDALNEHVKSSANANFFSAGSWPKRMNMNFRQSWYVGHSQHYDCSKDKLEDEMAEFAGGSKKATSRTPEVLEKTSALTRNALAVSGFLELATEAIGRSVNSSKSAKAKVKDVKAIIRVANRAAYHASCNTMAAAANMDLWRRDIILSNCPLLPAAARETLRTAPLGKKTVFDKKVCKRVRKRFASAIPKRMGKGGRGKKGGRPFRGGRGGAGHPSRQDGQGQSATGDSTPKDATATNSAGRGRGRGRGRGAYKKGAQ